MEEQLRYRLHHHQSRATTQILIQLQAQFCARNLEKEKARKKNCVLRYQRDVRAPEINAESQEHLVFEPKNFSSVCWIRAGTVRDAIKGHVVLSHLASLQLHCWSSQTT